MHDLIHFIFVDVIGGFIELLVPPMTTQDIKYIAVFAIIFTILIIIRKITN